MTLVIQQDLLSRGRRRIIHNGDFLLFIAKVLMLQKLPEQKTTPPRSGCVTGSDAKPNEEEEFFERDFGGFTYHVTLSMMSILTARRNS